MGNYLKTFLEDLKKQTIFPNFEIVLDLNDPEPWELELVHQYIEKYPKELIKLIVTSPVEPIGVSMNTCIKEASGEYLTIWNVDDLREPDSLERQMKVLDENEDVDIVNTNFKIVTSFGSKIGQQINHTIYPESEYKRGMILGPFFMFRKTICERAGYFDEQLKSGADFDFAIRLAYNGKIMFSEGNGGFYLNEGLGASTSGDRQPIEKTFIYVRYGINDKIINEECNPYMDKAMKYDIENVTSYGKKINYKTYINS
jgi:glycosyltransferase involved in cell wall biosynthesis